ncbi:PDZ domain (Also known as DHR or GLGF) family protein [Brugia pahangi]
MFNWSLSISSTTLKSVKSLSSSTSSSFSRTFLENITRSPFYHSFTSLDKTKLWSKFYVDDEENVQKVLDAVSVDQKVITNPHSNRRRRTVIVTRNNGEPFGFTLQTYLLKRKGDDVPSKITYVDYVQLDSPAADAGVRAGDVIISINGHIVTAMSHEELIELIGSYHQMRMIVIFENIRQRIELVARAIKLRKILNDKLYQLNLIDIEEQKILNRAYLRSLSSMTNTKYSLTNSLSLSSSLSSSSSAGISSTSSVCSVPLNISNDAKRNIIRVPTIISLTDGVIEINRYPLRRQTLERLKISNSKWLTNNLRSDSSDSNVINNGMEFLAVQRICCCKSHLNVGHASSLSCDTGQAVNPFDCFNNCCGDNTDNVIGSSNYITIESDNGDNDCDRDTTAVVDVHRSDIDNDGINIVNPALSSDNIITATISIPLSKSTFDSVALNHVIMLDNDVISDEDDDDNDKIRVLKL